MSPLVAVYLGIELVSRCVTMLSALFVLCRVLALFM